MNWFGTYLEVDPEVGTPGLGGLRRVIWFGGVPSHDDSVKVMTMFSAPPFMIHALFLITAKLK